MVFCGKRFKSKPHLLSAVGGCLTSGKQEDIPRVKILPGLLTALHKKLIHCFKHRVVKSELRRMFNQCFSNYSIYSSSSEVLIKLRLLGPRHSALTEQGRAHLCISEIVPGDADAAFVGITC